MRNSDLYQNMKILVMGMGKSGLSAAKLLLSLGAMVDVYDDIKKKDMDWSASPWQDMPVNIFFDYHFFDPSLHQYDLAVISPGIALDNAFVQIVMDSGVELIGEMELGTRLFEGKFIAITGTNGKSTTSSLIHHILVESGQESLLAGNIGEPLTAVVEKSTKKTIGVLEVSSYQLETIQSFHPHIALITNISNDHLARHKTMEYYCALKAKVFCNQDGRDYVILNAEDERVLHFQNLAPSQIRYFSTRKPVSGAYFQDQVLKLKKHDHTYEIVNRNELLLPGLHNVENALGAICVCDILGLSIAQIRNGIMSFHGVEHRQEIVETIAGVTWINDSKATNTDSTIMALNSYDKPIYVLLGGSPKKTDYSLLAKKIVHQGVIAIVYGQTQKEIVQALEDEGYLEYRLAKDLFHACELAKQQAQVGDIVLLSPACPSFDSFQNFEHRGQVFKEIVHAIGKREK